MKKRFYISAIYTSPPTTMGGNTKIMIEIVNNLYNKFDFIIMTSEPETFKKNLTHYSKVKIVPINYPFARFNYFSHYSEITYINKIYSDYFKKNKLNKNDYFFTPSDFAPDVLPVYNLRKMYEFKWIASLFLFIPNPVENLNKGYKFPFFKYIIYYFYQKYVFSKILDKGDLFLITNDYDRKYFPKKLKDKILAIYGGVNPEQIEEAKKEWNHKKTFDTVFCSRLHPQKGINQLLEVWAMVVQKIPDVKFAIIGNGEKSYEEFLKNKAKKLGIEKNIKWFGYVNNVDKYKIYLQSKVFLHGTIYDNNGMVAAEALCTGLPVIMYDLPQLRDVYKDGCTKIEINNKYEYAEKIIEALRDKKSVSLNTSNELTKYWNWKKRSSRFYFFILRK